MVDDGGGLAHGDSASLVAGIAGSLGGGVATVAIGEEVFVGKGALRSGAFSYGRVAVFLGGGALALARGAVGGRRRAGDGGRVDEVFGCGGHDGGVLCVCGGGIRREGSGGARDYMMEEREETRARR